MDKLKIAYFKSKYGDKMDKLIDLFDGKLGYSHTELIIDAQTTIGSSYLNGGVGVFKYSNIFNSKKWTIVEYDIPSKPAIDLAYSFLGRGYDTLGVVLHYIGIDKGDSIDKMWCSELTTACFLHSLNISKNIKAPVETKETLLMPNESFVRLYNYKVKNKILEANNLSCELYNIDKYDRIAYEYDPMLMKELKN